MISLFSREEVVYGIDCLAKKNPLILKLQDKYGNPNIVRQHGGVFLGLIRAIISQQINTKVANSIYKNFGVLYDSSVTPDLVLHTGKHQLASIGLSRQKIEYIYSVARFFEINKYIDDDFCSMEDDRLREELIGIRGVGNWTIDMILIFSLGRADIFPVGDFGIKRGLKLLFNQQYNNREMIEVSKIWKPYRTIFSWYLWKISS